MALQRHLGTGNDHGWPMISAHGVECDATFSGI